MELPVSGKIAPLQIRSVNIASTFNKIALTTLLM
jgi:hypothetical protein